VGRLEKAFEEFFIHLERGERFNRSEGPANNNERQPRDKPLQSAKIEG
jgi:hypothetical protein